MSSDEQHRIIGRVITEERDLSRQKALMDSQLIEVKERIVKLFSRLPNLDSSVFHMEASLIPLADFSKLETLLEEREAAERKLQSLRDQIKDFRH